jgi:hypothetical protein
MNANVGLYLQHFVQPLIDKDVPELPPDPSDTTAPPAADSRHRLSPNLTGGGGAT